MSMKKEEKVLYLSRYADALEREKRIRYDIERLEKIGGKSPELAGRIDSLRASLLDEIEETIKTRREIEKAIATLKSPKARKVLYLRFISPPAGDGTTWGDIADILYVSYDRALHIYLDAVKNIEIA